MGPRCYACWIFVTWKTSHTLALFQECLPHLPARPGRDGRGEVFDHQPPLRGERGGHQLDQVGDQEHHGIRPKVSNKLMLFQSPWRCQGTISSDERRIHLIREHFLNIIEILMKWQTICVPFAIMSACIPIMLFNITRKAFWLLMCHTYYVHYREGG